MRVLLRYNLVRDLSVDQRLEEMTIALGDYCLYRRHI